MLKQQLQQKLQQKLSPAQIQVIKMLEIPTLELEEKIRQEIAENPAIEEGMEIPENRDENQKEEGSDERKEDFGTEDFMPDDEVPDYKLSVNNYSKDDKQNEIPFSAGSTLHEYLSGQVGLLADNDQERQLILYIIGNVDDEGYLRRGAESMVDDLAFQVNIQVSDEEMLRLIEKVRQLDPPGVGATTLQECLELQLQRKQQTPTVIVATHILKSYFQEFSKKHYAKILKGLGISKEELKEALAEIIKLNPKPGNAWGGGILDRTSSVIIPDFLVENTDGVLNVTLNNSNVPELRVNRTYSNMLKDYVGNKENRTKEMKDALMFVKQKVDSAQWFIEAIKQRQQTLMTTMSAIVNYQQQFFLEGDETFLKPMVLKDIADKTGYDISTISRVSNSKYVETDFGIYPIKYFFSESMINELGEEVSTREIKKIMQEVVADEDKRTPLNDDRLVDVLREKGYVIARRTVAKYREQLNIPVARLRKEL